jgi:hypothetical protein
VWILAVVLFVPARMVNHHPRVRDAGRILTGGFGQFLHDQPGGVAEVNALTGAEARSCADHETLTGRRNILVVQSGESH